VAQRAVSSSKAWKPNVPSPITASTGRSGQARRAATAIGNALPIEPLSPLNSRSRGSSPACTHWPNSPPSHTSSAPAATWGASAAHTRSG
jgi:hypothetical protein